MATKEKRYHYLYKTTNLLNQKYYIGIHSTNVIDDGYLGSGKRLWYSINKYGKENFKREILNFYNSRQELALAEKEIITKEILLDSQNMNCQFGGEGFNTLGMATVKDKEGNILKVFCDDERYLSGELVGITKGSTLVKDKDENIFLLSKNDERYLSGELVSYMKGRFLVKDKYRIIYHTTLNDERYLSGELVSIFKGMITVKDKNGNTMKVSCNDDRYLSGELVSIWKNRNHTEETKILISEKLKVAQKGGRNSQYGTCWITKDGINKKCKIEDFNQYLNEGWIKGRKIK